MVARLSELRRGKATESLPTSSLVPLPLDPLSGWSETFMVQAGPFVVLVFWVALHHLVRANGNAGYGLTFS